MSAMLTLDAGRAVLAQQAFSRLLGTELTVCGEGLAQLELAITEQLKQQNGFVHGGVLSYLADNALTYAGGLALGPNVLTAEFKINYLRPALGERLIVRATIVNAGKTQAVVRCDISVMKDGAERLCAAAQGTIAKLPEASAASDKTSKQEK